MKVLLEKIKEAALSVLPIVAIVLVLSFTPLITQLPFSSDTPTPIFYLPVSLP